MASWLRRCDRADLAFLALAVLAAAVLMRLGLGLTFFADEWTFIQSPSLGDPASWFEPHNEHWSTLPIVAYRLLVETVGLGSYVPYLALITVLHLIVASLVYVLAKAKAGAVVGLGAAVIVLFLGSGFENLFWGFQIGFIGSTAAGLGAMALLDGAPTRMRIGGAITLLIAGLMCSGMGVTFLVVVAVELLLDPRRRGLLPLLMLPIGIYAAWYLALGHVGITAVRNPFTLTAISGAPLAIVRGLGHAVGGASGVGPDVGSWAGSIGAVLLIVTAGMGRLGPATSRACGCLAGIAAQYALIGIFRTSGVEDATAYSRYTYISATLTIVGMSAVIGALWLPGEGRAHRVERAWRRGAPYVGGAILALALTWNVRLLLEGRELFERAAATTRAFVTVGLEQPRSARTDPKWPIGLVPAPADLQRIVDRYGSPLADSLAPGFVGPIDPELRAEAVRRSGGAAAP